MFACFEDIGKEEVVSWTVHLVRCNSNRHELGAVSVAHGDFAHSLRLSVPFRAIKTIPRNSAHVRDRECTSADNLLAGLRVADLLSNRPRRCRRTACWGWMT